MSFSFLRTRQANSKSKYALVTAGIAILIVAGLILYGNQDIKITLNNTDFTISGMYGTQIQYDDVLKIDTTTWLPNIQAKTNGYSFSTYYKGNFRLQGVGNVKLFVNTKISPFICLKLKDNEVFYINYSDSKRTLDLYKNLKDKISKNR